MLEVSKETKLAILRNEMQVFANTKYQQELRYRVQKGLGATAEELKQIENELVRIERAYDILQKEEESLNNV